MTELLIPIELVIVNRWGVLYDFIGGGWVTTGDNLDKFQIVMQPHSSSLNRSVQIIYHRHAPKHFEYKFKDDVALWVNDNIKSATFDSMELPELGTKGMPQVATNFSSENDALLFKLRWL